MNTLRLALVGAPNCGKSTLFNGLTGGRAKVANYPGVTVETRVGRFETPAGHSVELIDLPGVYGLTARSMDERVTINAITGKIEGEAPNAILVMIDAGHLRTHLQTVLQMRGLGIPMLVVLNMIDLAERDGMEIDIKRLEEDLGVPVITSNATRKVGREALLERLDAEYEKIDHLAPQRSAEQKPLKDIQREARFLASNAILHEPIMNQVTRVVDRYVLHPWLGLVILMATLFFMFQAVYTWATVPVELIDAGFGQLGAFISQSLPDTWFRSLIVDGVIAGVGSVLVFLPQIVILFAFILLLEASGYMARAAFIMDELMLRVGLNGRAFIPLLSSFACAIPGMMAARTIENERDRLTTILVAPLMTCSARLPVYTLIIAAMIPSQNVGPFSLQGLVMFGLYMAGIVGAIVVAFVLKRTVTKGPPQALIMELPTYKLPTLKDYFLGLWLRAWSFVRRAGTIIFTAAVALWFLASYPASVGGVRGSFAGMIGGLLEPLLRPIGFNLEIAIALVPGMAAREVAVASLGTVYALQGAEDEVTRSLTETLSTAWSLPTGLAFLAWYVFAPQCFSTLAVARREMNSTKWTLFMFGYLMALAYVAAGVTFHLSSALLG